MTRLNNPGVDWADRYLIDSFATDVIEDVRIGGDCWPFLIIKVFPQRIEAFGPILVQQQRSLISYTIDFEPKQRLNFTLIVGGTRVKGSH